MTTKFYKVPVLRNEWELPERYKNLKLVKRTAFGQVCSATDTIFDVTVEIKKWNKPFVSIDNAKRAYREIKTLKFVNHENIVGLLDVFCRDDSLYFITEHCTDNLNNIIRTQRLSNENIQLLVYQIVNGLNYLHRCGITHGDLKPSDIGINKNFELKIIDLNVERPSEKDYVITKWYKAPESLYTWKPSGQSVDMWSLGCILAEFLSGRILFAGRDHLQQLKLIIELLGTPSPKFFEPTTPVKSLYSQNLLEGEKFIRSLPFLRRRNFTRYFEDGDPTAVDLVEQLLVLEPEERLTSTQAINHPFFKDFPKKNYDGLPQFDNNFEADEFELDKWRDLIFKELANE